MDFRQLQYMLKVAEERSFSKAAQKLYISQPSLSQYIQKIESQLGVQLFDRSSTPLTLTYAGELYVKTAKQILDLRDQLSQQMDDVASLKKGRLTIGVSPFRSAHIIPKILPSFHDKFPGIEVVLMEGTSSELENLILKGSTDIAITTLPEHEKLISFEPIMEEKLLIALPPNHPLSINSAKSRKEARFYPPINLSELHNEPFILLKQHQKLHRLAIDLCNKAGFEPRVVLETKSIETAHVLVSTGMGATIIPDSLIWSSRIENPPAYFSINEFSPSRTLVIAHRNGKYLSKAAQEFISISKNILANYFNF